MVSFFGQRLRRGRSPVQHNGAKLLSCYVTSCYVTSCYVTSRHIMLRYIMLCYITSPPGPLPQIFHHVMSGQRLQAPSLPSQWHVLYRTASSLEPLPCSLSIPGKGIAVPYRFGCLLIM